jgi:hypothetical protein
MVPKDPKYFTLPVIKRGSRSDYCAIASGRNHQKLKFDIDFASLAIKGRASKEFGFKYNKKNRNKGKRISTLLPRKCGMMIRYKD